MLLKVDLSNQIRLPEIRATQEVFVKVTGASSAFNLEPKQTSLNKETVVQLHEVHHDLTILEISSKKDDVDFSGKPRLDWLKGRNDSLYDEKIASLSRGATTMKKFAEIVERTKNNDIISNQDWQVVKSSIARFEMGVLTNQRHRAETDDPIVHRVLDYIMPKTQQRINTLKEFLASKSKAPEVEGMPNNLNIRADIDIPAPAGSSSKQVQVNELLDFLVKDLKWYQWYLEDKKENRSTAYSLQLFHLSYSKQSILTSERY